MATHSQRGQVLIELAVYAALLAGFFVLGLAVSEIARGSQEQYRFKQERNDPWRGGHS